MYGKGLFIASTGQHVGKTTTCLGIVSGLKKRFENVGFMKPVGQEHVQLQEGVFVDKDVLLFKDYFQISSSYSSMSPILLPSGFTRNFLDGKVKELDLSSKIQKAYHEISSSHAHTVVEGTGNVGVGSIINLNNAQVCAHLALPLILIGSGGLGSTFDELALNKALCEKHGIKVAGVILNRVLPEKREMIIHYMTKALSRWDIPLLGAIPFDPLLSAASMKDYENLFNSPLLTGLEHRLRHFSHIRLVATYVDTYKELSPKKHLIITPANREDIILETIAENGEQDLEAGMILTGDHPPRAQIIFELQNANIPMLYAPVHSHTAMKMISLFTAKIQKEDLEKVREAVSIVESHINFDLLLQ